jgi:hypothetical protein
MTHPRTDSDREHFAALIIAGRSLTDAAAQVGISRTTATRWRASPEVADVIEAHRREVRLNVSDRLTSFVDVALDRAGALLNDPDTPPTVVARLVAVALAECRQWADNDDMLRRLNRLEHGRPDEMSPKESLMRALGLLADDEPFTG